MKVVPEVKELKKVSGYCEAENFSWYFADGTDKRVINYSNRICSGESGVPVYISHSNGNAESYTLSIHTDKIEIIGDGAAGAFYGLVTLKMLHKSSGGKIECCEINDRPDMSYRGFYQDTTRGRVPKLETLKKLADTMAEYKLNSLQLYVEHSYEFREYEFCREELGYLTKAEIKELDAYCKERFIELVPSLSTFGHLYHLLQSEQYKHLCELKDYIPSEHHYVERMAHHTINPTLDESFELVKSLIDQHMSAFSSDKFNICCDETFDLGKGVNAGLDKGELYINFVKKLISYVESKGKKVMMWGDIVLQHPERLPELPESVSFLNWYYDKQVSEKQVSAFEGKKQIICPGTSAWWGFHEIISIEEPNITNFVKLGVKYGAYGILNTNWGDLGNPASIDMANYGLILGGAAGWNTNTAPTPEYKKFISEYHYGCPEALDILTRLSNATTTVFCKRCFYESKKADAPEEYYISTQKAIEDIIEQIKNTEFTDENIKREFLIAAEGDSLVVEWYAASLGIKAPSSVDFDCWLDDYIEKWNENSKQSELSELTRLFVEKNLASKKINS